jgi:hypothetical protein
MATPGRAANLPARHAESDAAAELGFWAKGRPFLRLTKPWVHPHLVVGCVVQPSSTLTADEVFAEPPLLWGITSNTCCPRLKPQCGDSIHTPAHTNLWPQVIH